MPYDYLSINESDLTYGIVSASYLVPNLQSLYEQKILNQQEFFGDNDDDIIEFSLYNSRQEPVLFNRIVPRTNYSVVEGNYRDINNVPKTFSVKNPFTNYVINKNELLLHTQFDLKINELGPGLYYTLYNPVRNIAGNSDYKLFIKEISPSRTELRLSLAFNPTFNDNSRINAVKISSFANKKFVFLQLIDKLIPIVENNPIESSFSNETQNINLLKYVQLLGLKSTAELQEFLSSTYTGYNKVINVSTDADGVIENIKFVGIAEQLKNFIYTYNEIEFTKNEILEAFRIIVAKVSQDAILQKTTLIPEDLTEITNIFIKIIYEDWLLTQTNILLDEYNLKYFGLYKNAINFDNGILVKILTHTSYINPIDNRVNIQIKLDEPLPLQYSIKDTCWISNISLSPIYFKVNLYTVPISKKVFLNGVNFNVETSTINPSNEKYSNFNERTIFAAESRLKQKINDLLVNFDDFNDFINFSSAELRSKIAKNKILQYKSLDSSKSSIESKIKTLNTNGQLGLSISSSYSSEYTKILDEQIDLLDSFDDYESYLFYNTSSIDSKIQSGVDFDKRNYNSLFYQLPEFIKTNEDYSDYIKFTAMVGHFFDNILIFIKKFPKSYPIDNNDNNSYPKNYIEELLNSMGWDKTNVKFNRSGINQLLFNNKETTGSLSSSYFDYAKSIFNRIGNNLNYIYKTKGTSNSFELIRSIFGISSDLLDVVEYTTPSVLTNRNIFYDFDDIIYATKFDSNQYIKFDFKNEDFDYVLSSQWTSGSTSLVGASQVTQSYIEEYNGISTVETTFRIKNYKKYNFGDKISLIKKLRNNKIDWQIYLYKTQQEKSAKLIFELNPKESSFTSSISSIELPYLNGDFYTFMLRRSVDDSFTFDELPLSVNKNSITQSITSSASEKYIPNIYTLYVNQYYGSQLNFTDKKTKTVLYEQNRYFSSGSYYIGNYLTSKQFEGNIDKIKVQKMPLSDEDFKEHSYNLGSISIPEKDLVYSNMFYLWSFDTPVNLYSTSSYSIIDNQNSYYNTKFYAYNFGRNSLNRGFPYCDTIQVDKFPYQFEKFNIKQSTNSNRYGPNYKSNANIFKIQQNVDSNLVPYQYSTYTNDIIGSDSNLVGYYISPYKYLNDKIVDFLGKEGISDIIGDPKYLNFRNYPELKLKQKEFLKLYSKYIYPQEFYSTYKFYIDFSIFDFVKKLTPARSTLRTGLLLEPSVFERVKFNYKDIDVNSIDTNNSSSVLNFLLSPVFSSSLIDTKNTSSNCTIVQPDINLLTNDHNTYNYSLFEIKDSIDNRDFVYSKYGKFINVGLYGFTIRNVINYPTNDFYQVRNNLGIITGSYNGYIKTFTSSFNTVEIIGSGSGLISNQVTGSHFLNNIYYGESNSGYSKRHLSKFERVGTRNRFNAVSLNKYSLINGVKTQITGSLNYYTYVKGQNTNFTTVNRKGLPNDSSPIISIPGFLDVDIKSDNFPKYGYLTGSVENPNSIFVQLPLTCSTCTSASLNNYIMNL